jgi:hypothetical protein
MVGRDRTVTALDVSYIRIYTRDMSTITKPRTCCETHRDTCKFGRDHRWSIGWFGGAKSGLAFGEDGWHDSMICSDCLGVCVADLEDGQRA